MDNLSRLIEKEIKDKRMNTYIVNGDVSISHLVYADDVLIFSKVNHWEPSKGSWKPSLSFQALRSTGKRALQLTQRSVLMTKRFIVSSTSQLNNSPLVT